MYEKWIGLIIKSEKNKKINLANNCLALQKNNSNSKQKLKFFKPLEENLDKAVNCLLKTIYMRYRCTLKHAREHLEKRNKNEEMPILDLSHKGKLFIQLPFNFERRWLPRIEEYFCHVNKKAAFHFDRLQETNTIVVVKNGHSIINFYY